MGEEMHSLNNVGF